MDFYQIWSYHVTQGKNFLFLDSKSYFLSNFRQNHQISQVQHGMGLLINMQKSVFLALWEKYDTYGCEILQNESIFDKESEHLDGIRKFFV